MIFSKKEVVFQFNFSLSLSLTFSPFSPTSDSEQDTESVTPQVEILTAGYFSAETGRRRVLASKCEMSLVEGIMEYDEQETLKSIGGLVSFVAKTANFDGVDHLPPFKKISRFTL